MFIFRDMASIFQCHYFRISWFPVYNISKIIWIPSYCYVCEIYHNTEIFSKYKSYFELMFLKYIRTWISQNIFFIVDHKGILDFKLSPCSICNMPMKMEPTEGSETSAIRTKTPGNYPK
jgi:hypothetical protein